MQTCSTREIALQSLIAGRIEPSAYRLDLQQRIVQDERNAILVLTLSGGAGWRAGKPVSLNAGGCAARAARHLWQRRGKRPSATSIEEGASAAACAISCAVRSWHKVTADHWQSQRFVKYLFRIGWRAAFSAIVGDEGAGLTGEKADQVTTSVPLTAAELHLQAESLQQWARGEVATVRPVGHDEQRAARRRVLGWIASVLKTKQGGRSGQSARAQFMLLLRVIHGATWADAAKRAGFASGRAAVESFRAGKLWSRLNDAALMFPTERERELLVMRREAGHRAGKAIRWQRHAIGAVWTAATNQRERAVSAAKFARDKLLALRGNRQNRWQSAVKGLRAGHLR